MDAAYKILRTIRSHAKDTAAIVPSYAKSAATLIALGGNDLILCRGGEPGPMDPQVQDMYTGVFVPASSIKETVDFLEGLNDQAVKVSLTEKIPALMMGAYRASAKASKLTSQMRDFFRVGALACLQPKAGTWQASWQLLLCQWSGHGLGLHGGRNSGCLAEACNGAADAPLSFAVLGACRRPREPQDQCEQSA